MTAKEIYETCKKNTWCAQCPYDEIPYDKRPCDQGNPPDTYETLKDFKRALVEKKLENL